MSEGNGQETSFGWILGLLAACAALIIWATVTGGLQEDPTHERTPDRPQTSHQP